MTVFYGYRNTFSDRKDTTDGTGTVIGRVMTTQTYRMPDRILLDEQRDTYALRPSGNGFTGSTLVLVASDVKHCEWDPSAYGPNGPLNQPKERSEVTKSYGYKNTTGDPNGTPTWQQIAETRTAFAYDSFTGKLLTQTTTRLTLQQHPVTGRWALAPETSRTKTLDDHAASGGGWVGISGYNVAWQRVVNEINTQVSYELDLDRVFEDFGLVAGRRPGGITSGGG